MKSILYVRILREAGDNVKKKRSADYRVFPLLKQYKAKSLRLRIFIPATSITIDNWSPFCATLATRYSGVRFQPFFSTPVKFTILYNNVETQRNARKV